MDNQMINDFYYELKKFFSQYNIYFQEQIKNYDLTEKDLQFLSKDLKKIANCIDSGNPDDILEY